MDGFVKIAVLYSDIGRPNFPVNILMSLEFIKQQKIRHGKMQRVCCFDKGKNRSETPKDLASPFFRNSRDAQVVSRSKTLFSHADQNRNIYKELCRITPQ
jgi:hypothetical protein